MLAFQKSVVAHEDDQRILKLPARLQILDHSADAIVNRKNGSPVSVNHSFEIDHRFWTSVREILAPFEERSIDSMPSAHALANPLWLAVELERAGWITHLHCIEHT